MAGLHGKKRGIRLIGLATIDLVVLIEAKQRSHAARHARRLHTECSRGGFNDIAAIVRRLQIALEQGDPQGVATALLVELVEAVDAASTEFDLLPPSDGS